ncbi:MAG: hypothetical protein ACOC43_10520 [Desulfohalobiaceae bacterium]
MKESLALMCALVLSLALNLLCLWLMPGRPVLDQEQPLLRLELFSRLQAQEAIAASSGKNRVGKQQHGLQARQEKARGRQEQILYQPQGAPGRVVSTRVKDPQLQAALDKLKQSIAASWEKARPPAEGMVEVRLLLNSQGEIDSLWILRLEGSPALADFVQRLLRRIAPFKGLVQLQQGQMTLDCVFRVGWS